MDERQNGHIQPAKPVIKTSAKGLLLGDLAASGVTLVY